jgi:hypothetical protein
MQPMEFMRFRLKRTITANDPSPSDREDTRGSDRALEPGQIDRERMDAALSVPRFSLPANANTPEEIGSYLDMLAQEVK